MEMSNNPEEKDSDFILNAEKHIDIISTEDERIKIIGEELANDTGRAIIDKLSQEILSTNDLAKKLDISIPLVNWHITRLLNVGLIKVEKVEMSSKNKEVKYYGRVKDALVIVPTGNSSTGESRSKKESILLRLRHYLASITAFVISGATIYLVQKNQLSNTGPNIPELAEKSAPQAAEQLRSAAPMAPSVASAPTTPPDVLSAEPMMVLISIIGGAVAFCAVFFGIWYYKKSKTKLH